MKSDDTQPGAEEKQASAPEPHDESEEKLRPPPSQESQTFLTTESVRDDHVRDDFEK